MITSLIGREAWNYGPVATVNRTSPDEIELGRVHTP